MRWWSYARGWLGVELDPVSRKEKFISGIGGFVAILFVLVITQDLLGFTGAGMVIASMGASAVLLFAVPHGQLSQPWPVVAGHVLSATLGVFCARNIPNPALAAACAVGAAIAAMHQLKCIHPPGGATALTAVIGGPGVHELGYSFVWHPVLINAVVIVAVAVAFNSFFRWRRYPAIWHERYTSQPGDVEISHEAVVSALESFDSFVDITEDDLIRLHQLLSRRVGKDGEKAERKAGGDEAD